MMKYLILAAILIIYSVAGQGYLNKDGNVTVPCIKYEDCRPVIPNSMNTTCINFECYCSKSGEESGSLCKPSDIAVVSSKQSNPLVARVCKHSKDCYLKNGFCNTSISQCECLTGFVSSSDSERCLPIAATIGSTCEDNKQCLAYLANSTCSNMECKCVPGYHYANSKCYKSVAFGESCNFNEECMSIIGAECNAGLCTCSIDAVINPQNNNCLPLAQKINDFCSESVQCSKKFGDNSECMGEKCVCQEHYHFDNKVHRCVVNKRLGDSCEGDYECYQGETGYEEKALQCIAKQCHCTTGFEKNEDNICVSGATTLTLSMTLILSSLLYVSL
ncbi:prion-like-(Q/N-rich) domain-bearing protein 25 isoform X2 [Cephus cinctus]|uniref:Prion-like-(Q/N-rich) domain-bearing protein 25 isoform X2 n=1 Tax=Cephus cinctus TaxID=211228 RepID=A0AAJ7C0D3_CEPCN|nr:prion-like-(Q/N-rich) domain-bearing protein 25 isoform X2 [Cephus cinctus]